ncbi:MAG: DUF4013 domain-containing protein [Anaerolinea sp.]|nr:DUF4013 domain-containing protein [Anaerolinea sp.]MCC6976035.1 DUF4013 domain-containing protein [Anaerolineae bacterium]
MNLEIGRSVTFPFEDPQWGQKLIVFLVIGFIPGLNLIVWSGYALTTARNLARGADLPLSSWADWSDIAVRGLLGIAATGVYLSPAFLITGCLALASLALGGRAAGAFLSLRCVGFGVAILFVLLMSYVLWIGHTRFAQTDQFQSYLDFSARLRDARAGSNLFGTLFLYQTLLMFLMVMLTIVAGALFLFALSVIATASVIGSLVALVFLALALVGYVAIVTAAFLANGYILGMAAHTAQLKAKV